MTAIYTQKTVRAVARIQEQQLRSWKTKVNIGRLDEPNARFNFSELLTLYIVSLLVNETGLRIGTVAEYADEIFAICSSAAIDLLKDRKIVINPGKPTVALRPLTQPGAAHVEIVILLGQVIDDMIAELTRIEANAGLPLFAVGAAGNPKT
ncbi:hypothetical protein [Novosphingobium sp.]|uniref:hypothetical protein n=1 Tax=Novosphingobium sp. TaxID=1874826 RepID=UPI002FDEB906